MIITVIVTVIIKSSLKVLLAIIIAVITIIINRVMITSHSDYIRVISLFCREVTFRSQAPTGQQFIFD